MNQNAEQDSPSGTPSERQPSDRNAGFGGELMVDPPKGDYHLGRFAGHRSAKKLRLWIVVSVCAAGAFTVFAYHRYVNQLRYEHAHPLAEVEAMISKGAPRVYTWNEGEFRIALRREAPAVNQLRLPDRLVSLADGCDFAELTGKVEHGSTVELRLVRGKVIQEQTEEN